MPKNVKPCLNSKCGLCAHMTNVKDENREEANVMGGCFIDGHITFTDCKGYKKKKKWCKQDNL